MWGGCDVRSNDLWVGEAVCVCMGWGRVMVLIRCAIMYTWRYDCGGVLYEGVVLCGG